MIDLAFNTPLRNPKEFSLWSLTEEYLDLGGNGYRIICVQRNPSEGSKQSVYIVDDHAKQATWKTAVKIISYMIVVLPLVALAINTAYRLNYQYDHQYSESLFFYQKWWSDLKELPQYKYLARPVYKLVASKTNPIIATAASFLITDLVMHQLLSQAAMFAITRDSKAFYGWSPLSSFVWLNLAMPVMYAKYKKLDNGMHSY